MKGSTATELLAYRSRWYAIETRRLVSRHWQWLAMVLLALSAGPMVVLMISAPALSIFAGLHGMLWNFIALMALLVIALLWSGVQRVGITGGAFGIYLRSLPLESWPRLWADIVLLLIADSLLFLPLVISALYVAALPLPGNWPRCAAVLAMLSVILVAQRVALTRRVTGLAAGVAACAVLAAGFAQPDAFGLAIAAGAAVAVAIAMSLVAKPVTTVPTQVPRLPRLVPLRLPPAWQIEAGALFKARRWTTLLRLASGSAIAVFALSLLARSGFDARSKLIAACTLAVNESSC